MAIGRCGKILGPECIVLYMYDIFTNINITTNLLCRLKYEILNIKTVTFISLTSTKLYSCQTQWQQHGYWNLQVLPCSNIVPSPYGTCDINSSVLQWAVLFVSSNTMDIVYVIWFWTYLIFETQQRRNVKG